MSLRDINIQKRRVRILNAARQIIHAQGPDALSMRGLATKSDLAVTTLYNLYGNKDAIIHALIEDAVAVFRPSLDAIGKTDSFHATLRLTTDPVRHLIENRNLFFPIIAVGYRNVQTRADRANVLLYAGLIAIVESFVATAQADGHFSESVPPRLLAAEVFYCYRSALEDWGCGEIDDEALARRVRSGVLTIYLSVANPKARKILLRELGHIQRPTISDLERRYPTLPKRIRDE